MFALLGCYLVIACGVLGLISHLMERGVGCERCGAPDGLTVTTRWLLAAMFAFGWPFLCAMLVVEIAERIRRQ